MSEKDYGLRGKRIPGAQDEAQVAKDEAAIEDLVAGGVSRDNAEAIVLSRVREREW